MFGYVTVYKPELKIKDFEKYRAYYCGLCRTLQKQYGFVGQVTLTYDMTFAIILLTSLYESATEQSDHRCVVHPIKKQQMLQNEITEYAAAMNVVLAYYHMQDDWQDDKSVKGLAGTALLRRQVKQIEAQYPRQCKVMQEQLQRLQECEKAGSTDIDLVAGCFGELMGELFLYKQDRWEAGLRRFGFFLGKFIYIMDAFDDIEKDIKGNNYNPLKSLYENKRQEFDESCREMLVMMVAECSEEFEKLPCIIDLDILRNILYDGVWVKYHTKLEKLNKENTKNE